MISLFSFSPPAISAFPPDRGGIQRKLLPLAMLLVVFVTHTEDV